MTIQNTTARPILGVDRRTGEFVALMPSQSTPGAYHITTADRRFCDCRGFQYRATCAHVATPARPLANGGTADMAVRRAAGNWPTVSAETAAKAAEYRKIFGRDE